MKAVVVGSGSAGRRHTAALRARLPTAELVVVRRPDSDQPLEPLADLGATVVHSLDDAVVDRADLAVVASPSTHHVEPTLRFIAAGVPVLVEKPLASSYAEGETIRRAASRAVAPVLVGYHLRHSETPLAVRRALHGAALGGLLRAELTVGQHLEQWRPGSDPRRGVTARAELGGGVLLELSHELDALHWLVGPIETIHARLLTEGAPTDGAVDTVADLATTSSTGVSATVHLDMVSRSPRRRWRFVGTAGELVADLLTGTVHLVRCGERVPLHQSAAGERDRAEVAMIASLVDAAGARPIRGARESCSVDDAVHVLAAVEAARRSASTGTTVAVASGRAGVA